MSLSVTDEQSNDTTSQRYGRALRLSGPKAATATAGIAVEGYWLDATRFYFLAEESDASDCSVTAVPSIADMSTHRVEPVMPMELLIATVTAGASKRAGPKSLSSARFDMPDAITLAISLEGREYLLDVHERRVRSMAASLASAALYSPDGRYACSVRGHDLWLKERQSGVERCLTHDGEPHFCYGQESETCLSALSYRADPAPMALWSRDAEWLLTHQIDERHLPELPLIQHVPPNGSRPVLHRYKYPFPEDPVPIATYVAIHVRTGRRVRFDEFPVPVLGYSPFSSFYRTAWFSGEDAAWVLRADRYCKCMQLIRLNLANGSGAVVLEENARSGYIELHQSMIGRPNVRTLAHSNEVIWFSERDGWGHLYLYDAATATVKNRITTGEWLVRDIVHVDEPARRLFFTACGRDPDQDPARRSLCAVNLDGSGFEVLIEHDGDIAVPKTEPTGLPQRHPFRPSYSHTGVSPGGQFAVVYLGNAARGNVTQLIDLRAPRQRTVIAAARATLDDAQPMHFRAHAADGVTEVHGLLFVPSDFDERQRYPLIDYVYPGPHVAHQPQSFGSTRAAFARSLAELGFVTLMLDTRGMPFRQRAIRQAGYGNVLEPQLADHAAIVRQLCERHAFLDDTRVGMIGYSAGGAATARALLDYGEVFHVGVSVCGNHDNTSFAAMWSDKYRGPLDAARWAGQAPDAAARRLKGKLLLISGDMDENVHVSQTLLLADALIRANRDFDLLLVPNSGHDLLMTNGYVQRRAWDYFVRHLRGEIPPQDFEIRYQPHELARQEHHDLWELEYWR